MTTLTEIADRWNTNSDNVDSTTHAVRSQLTMLLTTFRGACTTTTAAAVAAAVVAAQQLEDVQESQQGTGFSTDVLDVAEKEETDNATSNGQDDGTGIV